MFNIIRNGANRLDVEFGGKLDSEEMKIAIDELIDKSDGIENGRMFFRITDYKLPTLGAIAIEFSRFPALFRFMRKIDRAALLADKNWVRKASEIEGTLIPGLTIKSFALGEEEEAEIWLESSGN